MDVSRIDGAIWAKGPSPRNSHAGNPSYWLARFDLDTREFNYVADTLTMWRRAHPFASRDAIWLYRRRGSGQSDVVDRFDVELRTVTDTLDTGWGIEEAVVSERAIWLSEGDSIHRIDLRTREVSGVIPVGSGEGPRGLASTDGAIWVTSYENGTVSRIDTDTRDVTRTIDGGGAPVTPLAFDSAIWVPDARDGTVTRIATGVATK